MNALALAQRADLPTFEVRFGSLFKQGCGYAFPCDGQGQVDLDALSERARVNYLYARAMVGRENTLPRICQVPPAGPSGTTGASQHH